MSERNKKKIFYALIAISILINIIFIVNVFALKLANRKYRHISTTSTVKQTKVSSKQVAALPAQATKEISASQKNLIQTSYKLGRRYETKADKTIGLQEKTEYYSLALLEYAKLPKKDPHYARLMREARERIQSHLLEGSTLLVALGDTRKQVEKAYGKPDRQVIDNRYLPSGSVTYEYYKALGLVVGISLDQVFSIQFCSNSPGLLYGMQIGDHFDKLKTLYKGKKIVLPGSNFGYRVNKLKTTFIFVDNDAKLDKMKIADNQYYGKWELSVR